MPAQSPFCKDWWFVRAPAGQKSCKLKWCAPLELREGDGHQLLEDQSECGLLLKVYLFMLLIATRTLAQRILDGFTSVRMFKFCTGGKEEWDSCKISPLSIPSYSGKKLEFRSSLVMLSPVYDILECPFDFLQNGVLHRLTVLPAAFRSFPSGPQRQASHLDIRTV